MALDIPDSYATAAFSHTLAGWAKPLVCTLGLAPDTIGQTWTTAMANSIFDAWKNAMDTSVTSNLTFTGCVLYVKDPLGFIPIPSTSASAVGTSSGTALPPNTAVMVEKITSRPGRSGRGRMFLPGFSEGAVDAAGQIAGASLTQLATDLTAFYTALVSVVGVSTPQLFHETTVPSSAPTTITSFAADARVSSIAKRFKR